MVPRMLGWAGVLMLLVLGGLGALFAAGDAWEDPGGWVGVAVSLLWLVPMVALAWLAWFRPDAGVRLLLPLAGLVALAWVAYGVWTEQLRELMDRRGPVIVVATLGVAFALGALGRHRPTVAGTVLLGLAAVNAAAIAVPFARDGGGTLGDLLSTSGGALIVPLLLGGGLLLAAGLLDHRHPHPAVDGARV